VTPSIEVERLSLNYGDVTALKDLTFTLEGNKIYGLLGRNGSGKTSLLSVLAAFRRATSGQARLGGQTIFENESATSQIAFIRESGDTVESSEKVSEALRYAKHLRPNWDAPYAAMLGDRFRISQNTRIGDMSRGERSALGIVLGLASRCPITIFDETYLGLDAPSRYTFYDAVLEDYMAHPRTFIISTHLIDEVQSIFEDVLIIHDGQLLLHEPLQTLLARGVSVSGPAQHVDLFVDDLNVIGQKQLGRSKVAMVYGEVTDDQQRRARSAGVDLAAIALQELFIHLTEQKGSQS
jgi:ABC-2 type transport system ATP-binding protein